MKYKCLGQWFFSFLIVIYSPLSVSDTKISFDERNTHKTKLVRKVSGNSKMVIPADPRVSIVKYDTQLGKMSAYLAKPKVLPNIKYPAILWITGGFPAGGGGSYLWEKSTSDNDQSAKSYWQNGIVTMYPAFRGEVGNPGFQEGFYGEVNDALAALDYLSKLDFVDPERIYLGGHSTGATLALLVAAATDKFSSVFAFGPVSDPLSYGNESQYHDINNEKENYLRAPVNFMEEIKSPTYIIEGESGNVNSLLWLQKNTSNKSVSFTIISGADHFKPVGQANDYFAAIINKKQSDFDMPDIKNKIESRIYKEAAYERKASDLRVIASAISKKIEIENLNPIYYFSGEKNNLESTFKALKENSFSHREIFERKSEDSKLVYYVLIVEKKIDLYDLKSVFEASEVIGEISTLYGVKYHGWGIK